MHALFLVGFRLVPGLALLEVVGNRNVSSQKLAMHQFKPSKLSKPSKPTSPGFGDPNNRTWYNVARGSSVRYEYQGT